MLKSNYLTLAAGLAAGGIFGGCSHQAADSPAGGGRRGGGPGAGAAIPIISGKVGQRDTPIYLDGIGTVQAFNTVTIHTQVNGVLQKVAFKEGQDVSAGDLLAVVDPRPYQALLDQANAKKAEDEAQLFNATVTYQRNESLLKQGLMDQQTVDTDKAAMDQAKAQVQADGAAAEQQSVMLGYCSIRSPINGRTGLRMVDQGNLVQASDAMGLVVVTQLKPISVIFTLPQQDWPQIQQLVASGQQLQVFSVDASSKPTDQGTLSVVDNLIDAATGTIKLKATFANDKLELWPGQFINVRLLVETRKNGIVVPASVIQRGPQGSYAFVVKPDSTVEARPVKVAQIDSDTALIDTGLTPGEQVVVDGQYKLQAGSKVTAAAPAPAKAKG